MKKLIAIVSLSVLPLMSYADNGSITPINITSAVVAPTTMPEDNGSPWRSVVTGLGIVGGVIIADLFMGGSLTASLFGWGTTAATGPIVYSPEVLSARAAGAVLGEMITPATNLRDVAARRDMFYALMLGVGGTIGAAVTYGFSGNSVDK